MQSADADATANSSRPSFKRQAGLILLSGALTVVVAPVASFLIEDARWKSQESTFAEKARLEIASSARREFLGAFSDACWSLQLAMIDVPFNRQFGEAGFQKACDRYDEQSPALFGRLRSLSEGAVWFTSAEMQQKLDSHIAWLLEQDVRILQLREANATGTGEWSAFHARLFEDTQSKTRTLIKELAESYGIMAVE
jgi:hypothetical protein